MRLILTAGVLCATLLVATIAVVSAETIATIADETTTPIEVVGE